MTIDMSQFKATFLEESYEGIETIEQILVNIDPDNVDSETINTIFRAAHSIKGGSATFGFNELTELTHLAETLLDEIRNNKRKLTPEIIDVFLQSVDCLREMLDSYSNDTTPDTKASKPLEQKLNQILHGSSDEVTCSDDKQGLDKSSSERWSIYFKPGQDIFLTGNDPIRIFKDLGSKVGITNIQCSIDDSIKLDDINSELCYISWKISTEGEISKSEIDEVFEWVVDDSELIIEKIEEISDENEDNNDKIDTIVTEEDSKKPDSSKQPQAQNASIRVDINKIDNLLNMVGELVITQSMLCQIGDEFRESSVEKLREGLSLLSQNTRELQESVMKIRMVPISFIFNRVPRMVFDLSKKLDKIIELKISGENTELDKTVMEKLSDPLTHLVRNSLDHGIEIPSKRLEEGKDKTGILQLNAFHEGGNIIIEIIDDGAGINLERVREKAVQNGLITEDLELTEDQIVDLVFRPGFSTAEEISDVSGRGVGMDVVRRNIQSLGGMVSVKTTKGKGSKFSIQLPLTLAILDGQLLNLGQHTFILPLVSIVESIQIESQHLEHIKGSSKMYKLRDEYIPIIDLYHVFDLKNSNQEYKDPLLVVVEASGHKLGVLVDELLAQQQVVIKSLESNYKKIEGISGATILGNGEVALILDVMGLVNLSHDFIKQLSGKTA